MGVIVDRFIAYPGADPFESFNLSCLEMIRAGIRENGPMIAFEDDAEFRDCSHLEIALNGLPGDWDVLYLGCNLLDMNPVRHGPNLCRIKSAWTTHAVAYSMRAMEFINEHFEVKPGVMFDDFLSREVLPKFNAFLVNPTVCWQRPGKSDLWNNQANYQPAFANADAIMSMI